LLSIYFAIINKPRYRMNFAQAMNSSWPPISPRLERLALLLVLLLGLALRLAHFHFFVPYFYYLDEIRSVELALRLFKERTLDPHYNLYPGFPIYLNALAFFFYFLIGNARAVWQSGSLEPVFAAAQAADGFHVGLILTGRGAALLAGTSAIYFVYRLSRDVLGARGGLLATLFFALNPMNITYSHLAKLDSMLVLWIALAYWGGWRLITEGRMRWAVLAGLGAGLSLATKHNYPPAFLTAFALILRGSREGLTIFQTLKDRRFLVLILIVAAVAFGTSPFWYWDLAENLKTVGWIYFSSGLMSFYHISDDAWWHDRYFYTLVIYWPFILGLPLAVLSFLGFARYALASRWDGYLIWFYPLGFLYGVSSHTGGSITYYSFILLAPFACIAAVYFLQRLAQGASLGRQALAGFLLAGCLAWSALAVNSYRDYFYGPYDQARPWLEEHLPKRADVVMVSVYFLGPAFGFARTESIWPHLVTEDWLRQRRPDYLLVDTRALAGFRKFYRRMPVAPLFDRIFRGELGYRVVQRFPTRYAFGGYFQALDLEHDTELVVLEREGGA